MNILGLFKKAYDATAAFVTRYPAILAAYVIYSYYFISTMDFYITFKRRHFSATEALSHFDTILWMWVLAWMLVRILELRDRLHEQEKVAIEHQMLVKLKEAELRTLHEVVMTLKHEINNPLAIILGYIRLAQKKNKDEDIAKKLGEIETAAQRINKAMKEFSLVRWYETTQSPVGPLVQIVDEKHPPSSPAP